MENARKIDEVNGRWPVQAWAKLNLGLRVSPPPLRPDGFHEIETWMVPVSWHDTLYLDGLEGPLTLEVTGRSEGVPVEIEKNLVGRAAVKLAAAAGVEARGRIVLHKVLPPGGGIGGGSSDAGAALLALNGAWGLNWSDERLEGIAAELGSDVPFFVQGRAKLCTGRGEIMTELPVVRALFAVLLIPPMGCPTKEVYQAFDAGRQHKGVREKTDWKRLAGASAEELGELLVNDLEPAAFAVVPELKVLRDRAEAVLQHASPANCAGEAWHPRRVHMTGSGSTLFVLCGSGAEAGEMGERLRAGLGEACVCVPVRVLR